MKIIFFSRLFCPHIGGVEKHVLEISKILVANGHEVTVITENFKNLKPKDNIRGIKIIRIKTGKEGFFKKFRVWKDLINYYSLIKSADIIHCHDIFFWYLPFRFLFPFKKVYVTFHGYEGNKIPSKQSIFMHKMAEKMSYGNICIGSFYKKWYGTKASIISYGAVDKKLILTGLKNVKPKKEAIFIGRLEEETGFFEYLKALKYLNLKLDVYGEGSLEKNAKKYAKINNLQVNFKGFDENAAEYIKDYKFVFTSRYLGILEAMAQKKFVFAQYNNKIKKDYLILTPFKKFINTFENAEGLVKEVNNYKKDKSTINVNKAYVWVKNQTWENMVNKYLQLWDIN